MTATTYPLPSGWRAICHVATCGYVARGHEQADAETALLEHLRLEHATIEPDVTPEVDQ